MKLRNKKTGEIIEAESCNNTGGCISIYYEEKDGQISTKDCYTSLAELNEEWEDYEEPKAHWCVTMYGGITRIKDDEEPIDDLIEIGNYFNSKEDAYDGLRKLKAWKRLKGEYDFKFTGWKRDEQHRGDFIITAQDWCTSDDKLLDLLFGGEE